MATAYGAAQSARGEERFFFTMACAMATVIVAGFSLNLAMARSSFAVPLIYHVHAFVFFGWVVIYLAQNWFVASGNRALHRRLGWLAVVWVPAMVTVGTALIIVSMRRTGGPFFFAQNEFLFANPMQLLCFAGLVAAAVLQRRNTDWHRRLMFMSMAILTGPGLGRLLPMPLLIPYAWWIALGSTLIFPLIAMIADKRRHGRVHPAWFYGIAAFIGVQITADLVANTAWGRDVTTQVLAGSPGADRPMEAYLPT